LVDSVARLAIGSFRLFVVPIPQDHPAIIAEQQPARFVRRAKFGFVDIFDGSVEHGLVVPTETGEIVRQPDPQIVASLAYDEAVEIAVPFADIVFVSFANDDFASALTTCAVLARGLLRRKNSGGL
jgi:hypothetical protein